MDPSQVDRLLEIAQGAGEILLARYGRRSLDVRDKADGSPVTDADLGADAFIRGELSETWPFPILSEESPPPDPVTRDAWPRYWLVDPLDGTREFVAGTGEFCTTIALMEGGRPILGLISAPMLATRWVAVRGGGAFRVDATGRRPLRGPRSEGPTIALQSRFHARPEARAHVDAIGVDGLRVVGSAIKYALLADGDADLIVSYSASQWWDVAAGQLMVEEVGAHFLALSDHKPPEYRGPSLTNPPFLVCSPRLLPHALAQAQPSQR